MKKISLILLSMFLTLPMMAQGILRQDGMSFKLYSQEGETPYAEVVGNLLTENTDVVIPATVTKDGIEYPVTGIVEAFSECEYLTAVTIPSSVTLIGSQAFYSCKNLTSVTIPNSVTLIGKQAFYSCTNLTSVTIPNSVTSIDGGAFAYCRNLTWVTIPNSVTFIGSSAFTGCSMLESVLLPPSIVKANGAFDYSAIKKGAYPNTMEIPPFNPPYMGIKYNPATDFIENKILWGKDKTSVLFVSNDLTGEVIIPNSVTYIAPYAFANCSGLTSVTIPNSISSIEEKVFANCSGLTSVIIPPSVTSISDYAFLDCSSLSSITIPKSIIKIGLSAFVRCPKLEEINYDTTCLKEFEKYIFDNNIYRTATLNIAKGGLDNAYMTKPWMYFVDIREKDFSGIEDVIAEFDSNVPVDVYDLKGVRVADSTDNLSAGLYIIRQGTLVKKVMVK